MSRISPAVRWWVLPAFTAGVCLAAAALNFIVGDWVAGGVLLGLAGITLIGRRTEIFAYRAGYWRGRYAHLSDERPRPMPPSPWDPMPPPPWASPAEH